MLALIRCSVPDSQTEEFTRQARDVLDLLAAQPGYVRGQLGRSVDEPDLWVLASEWEGAGHYRRALSAARMALYPIMTLMINEPSAFEVIRRIQDPTCEDTASKA